MFPRIDHILRHKASLNKFKKIEIIISIFSDLHTMKVEISQKMNTAKYTKIWMLKIRLLNNEWLNE